MSRQPYPHPAFTSDDAPNAFTHMYRGEHHVFFNASTVSSPDTLAQQTVMIFYSALVCHS